MIPVATTQLNHPYISTGLCFDGRICPSTLLQGGHSPIFLGLANNTTSTISLIANQQTCFCRDHIPSSSPQQNAPQPQKKHHPTHDTRFFLLNMDTIIPLPKKNSLNFKRPYSHSFPKTFLLGDLSHQFWTSKESSLPPKKNTPQLKPSVLSRSLSIPLSSRHIHNSYLFVRWVVPWGVRPRGSGGCNATECDIRCQLKKGTCWRKNMFIMDIVCEEKPTNVGKIVFA